MKPKRIQLKRTKGWRLPPNTVVVSRPTKWGNPYRVGIDGDNKECVRRFWLFLAGGCSGMAKERERLGDVRKLRGKNLACWCNLESPCHADVLLDIANQKQ